MNEKYRVYPSKIARSRKIQVRQFEPEEVFIEYNIEVLDPEAADEAVKMATEKAIEYLDREEERLRLIEPTYKIKISKKGMDLGKFRVKASEDPQYENFIHLWFQESETHELYVGHLHKKKGDFTFKKENVEKINKIGIKKEIHFEIVQN
ncbi:MAG: hypothetical protein ACXAD7_08605 [Candidatus Kariarchaeaceae archaeon]|jgi:hypothetical protein